LNFCADTDLSLIGFCNESLLDGKYAELALGKDITSL